MATIQEYTDQKAKELFGQGLPKEEVDKIIDEDLIFRGAPLKDFQANKITSEQFLSQEITPTIREHVNSLHQQGLTDDQIDLDMVNRGFYDLDRNMRDNLDQLLPETLDSTQHQGVMDGGSFLGITYRAPWKERYDTGGFTGHDPWELEPLKKKPFISTNVDPQKITKFHGCFSDLLSNAMRI